MEQTLSNARVRRRVAIPLETLGLPGRVEVEFVTFDGLCDKQEHIALIFAPCGRDIVTVRLHSECLTGDIFRSMRCDCGAQLRFAIDQFSLTGGCLLYLRQEGRGIGLRSKIDAYALQVGGLDTFEANRALGFPDDLRDYASAAQMLKALGYSSVSLLSNNPDKVAGLIRYGIDVRDVLPVPIIVNEHNRRYLRAKKHSGHRIAEDIPD